MAKLVNWHDFERKLKDKRLYLFNRLDVRRVLRVSPIATTFLLHRYAKKGFIIRVKRGLYVFSDAPSVPSLYIANKLYEPSYISLEFALSYHRVIPETVYEITSITTRATQRFKTLDKIFSYRRIKKSVFTGYTSASQRGFTFLIADPEKAFVDLTYLRILRNKKPLARFDKQKISKVKVLRYAKLFKNNKLTSIIKTTLR